MKGLILDTETTGLNSPQVIELAYLPVDENLKADKDSMYQGLFKPSKSIEPKALEIHGISMKELEGKPNSSDMKNYAPEVFADNYIIGHNIDYDIDAIKNSVGDTDFNIICTKRLALYAFPNQTSYSLTNLTKALSANEYKNLTQKAHRADMDVLMTLGLLEVIAQRIEAQTGKKQTLDTLYDLSQEIGYIPYEEYSSIIRSNW